MTPTQREAAVRLVDALAYYSAHASVRDAAALLRELAAEPQGEPVIAVVTTSHDYGATIDWTLNPLPTGTELYAHPPQRKPLTRGQISDAWTTCQYERNKDDIEALARAIERAHGIEET